MNDLINRLREDWDDPPGSLMREAADEIERLESVADSETKLRVGNFDTITGLQAQLESETKLHLENEAQHMALVLGLKNKIDTLTRERDEARAELAALKHDYSDLARQRNEAIGSATKQSALKALARSERDALRAAIEKHNAKVRENMQFSSCIGDSEYLIPLPAAAQGSAEQCKRWSSCLLPNGHSGTCELDRERFLDSERSAGAEPDCANCGHSYEQHTKGGWSDLYCRHCTCNLYRAPVQQSTAPEGDIK